MRKFIMFCIICLMCIGCIAGSQAGSSSFGDFGAAMQKDLNAAAGSDEEQSPRELPGADQPHPFVPLNTAYMDLLPAEWMMDEYTRALCTNYLTLDLWVDNTYQNEAFPMNYGDSRIGMAGDTIRLITQSSDGEQALIILYDAAEQTALFYATPWDDSTLASFEQDCTDQYFINTAAGLENADRLFREYTGNMQ